MIAKLRYWIGRIAMVILVALFAYAFAYTVPFDFALLAAVDMALYVDALFGVYVVARVARISPMLAYIRLRVAAMIQRFAKRARRPFNRSEKTRNSAANDDHPAFALAA